jgi:peroxiredoxin
MIAPGSPAPGFELAASGGSGERLELGQLIASSPTLLAFFKTSCPVCTLSFPLWGELARRYGEDVTVVGVSQDPLGTARAWLDRLHFHAPVVDDSHGYAVSDAYEIDTVPALVLVDRSGQVVASSQGWDRERANAWDAELAQLSGLPSAGPLSPADDGRPAFRPG